MSPTARRAILGLVLACPPGCATTDPAVRGHEALARGDDLEAARQFEEAVKRTPEDPQVWQDLARARMRSGRLPSALEAAERSMELAPWPETRLLRAQVRMGLRDRDGARADVTQAAVSLGTPARLQEAAVLLLRLGDVDLALEAAWRAVERSGGEAAAYANVAVLATEGRKPAEAHRAVTEGLARHPKDVALLQTRGALEASEGRVEEAVATYRTLLPLHPEPGLIHQALALLLHATHELDAAQRHADAAVASMGHLRADVHFTRVVILRDRGETDEARKALARARRRFPGDDALARLQLD